MADAPYLTVAEVATELGVSTSAVYGLIRRGKMPAIRPSSRRRILVPRIALDAYRRRLKHGPPPPPALSERASLDALIKEFRDATGSEPEEWMEAWEADRFEDSAENMRTYIQALGILAARKEQAAPEVEAVTTSAR